MKFLSIDPGCNKSGFVVYCNTSNKVIRYGKVDNTEILKDLTISEGCIVLIEKPDFLTPKSGREVIDTIFWAGRYRQFFKGSITYGRQYLKKSFGVKKDAEVIKLIKKEYPHVKLTKDSWQAFLLIHAFEKGIV
jgi:hypothetical protein